MTRARTALGFLFAGPLLLAAPARGQAEGWKNAAEVYVLGAGLSGTTGIGPAEIKVSATFDQILSNLQFGAMAAYRGESPTFAVTADVMYTSLATTVDGPLVGVLSARVDAKEWLVTATASWRVTPVFEALAGLRLTSLDNTLTLTTDSGVEQAASLTKTWVDPVVGVRVRVPLGARWSVAAYGDLGGFGVGSSFTWAAQVRVNWQVSRVVFVGLGYRILYQDYKTGSGSDAFTWNVTTQGPLAALGARF